VAKKIEVTWVKSGIGYPKVQRLVIRSLGLHKLNHSRVYTESPEFWGKVNKVSHLVSVREVE